MALTWVKALKSARIINSPLQSGQAALAYHCNPNDGVPQTTTTRSDLTRRPAQWQSVTQKMMAMI